MRLLCTLIATTTTLLLLCLHPLNADPLDSLAAVFGVKKVPHKLRNKAGAPLFLRRLQESLADKDGKVLRGGPYNSNTVISHPDKATKDPYFFSYNVTKFKSDDTFRYADLHLFRLKPKQKPTRKRRSATSNIATLIKIKLYQVTDPRRKNTPYGNILLSQKIVPSYQFGWVVFEVSQAVLNWLQSSGTSNNGLAVFAYNMQGQLITNELRFVQIGENRDILQPALMLYTSNGPLNAEIENNPLSQAFAKFDSHRYDDVYQQKFRIPTQDSDSKVQSRRRRDTSSVLSASSTHVTCRRYPMYVDFSKVGWDDWIISPTGYNAYVCQGLCPFPMGQQFSPTNHAVVQGIVSHLRLQMDQSVPSPCCVPSTLAGISMLYYDDSERVVLKQYDAMIATACGCK